MIIRSLLGTIAALVLLMLTSASYAHFLWIKTIEQDGNKQAFLYFGENPADEAYHLPERMADTELYVRKGVGQREKLNLKNLDTEDRIGLVAPINGEETCVLEASQKYGVYGQSLLVYHAKHIHASSKEALSSVGNSKELKLDILPQVNGGELELTISWDGKPVEGAKVSLAGGEDEAEEKTTDSEGKVTLKPTSEGVVGVLANFMDKGQSGKDDGKEYTGALHYASLTLKWPVTDAAEGDDRESDQASLPPLPEPVSSFGAAIATGYLYIYSGHIGGEHEHSAENLAKHFRRLKLDRGPDAEWEDLPMQTPLQGLAVVAHDGKIYRVGGLNARNATKDDEEQLFSVAEFAEFDPSTEQWAALPDLPTPRSSHNAVVVGDRLYVVGGWQLAGKSPGEWQNSVLMFDFAKPEEGWQELEKAPFKRRAIAAAEWQEQVVVIGGMDEEGEVSLRVDIYNPASGEWRKGPKLPGAGMAAFGASACNLDGNLYVSGLRGVVYRLDETGSGWEEATRLATGRFFHQLLPASDGQLLAVGGASREGHIATIETVAVDEQSVGRVPSTTRRNMSSLAR